MYNVTDLGTLGGKNSQANAINDPGDVAGRADDPQRFHAVRWDRRPTLATIDLHDPNWGLGQNRDTSIALSINNAHGQVVGGTVPIDSTTPHGHAFFCPKPHPGQTPQMVDLDLRSAQDVTSIARSINDHGQIAGHRHLTSEPAHLHHAVFWESPSKPATLLAPLGQYPGCKAAAINARTIVGRADINVTNYDFQACWWSIQGGQKDWLKPLGKSQSYAWAINAHDQVVGVYGDNIDATLNKPGPLDRYACFWESTSKPGTRLFQEQGFAMGINDHGEIVGLFVPDPPDPMNPAHAFYYTAVGGRQDLNDLIDPSLRSTWTLTAARGINNRGEIVGLGLIGRDSHAFLLTPIAP